MKQSTELKKKRYYEKYGDKIDSIINLTKNGFSNKEIKDNINIGTDIIINVRKLFELNAKEIYENRAYNSIDLEKVLSLISDKYTIPKLSKYFKVSVAAMTRFIKINNISIEDGRYLVSVKEDIELTFEEEQVLIGGLLGDSWIGYPRNNKNFNVCGSFTHCLEQEEYCNYKYNILKRLCSKPVYHNKYDKRFDKRYQQIFCKINAHQVLRKYRELFYPNDKKIVPIELLNKLEGLGLAIWFMDDGTKCGKSYQLCTNAFSLEDLYNIQDFFLNKFYIKTTIRKDNTLYIRRESTNLFIDLIEEYITNDMLYKL